ncbi:MAG: hypothetical protein K9J13_16690 [Saprospiraceae bacterium]|nr:hypothetical protein [Saprospiraceae bacterium]
MLIKILKIKSIIYLLFLFLIPALTLSQELVNLRNKKLLLPKDTIKLDSLSIIPGSTFVLDSKGNTISDSLYKFDYAKSLLIIKPELKNLNQELIVNYKVFPYDFSKEFKHKELKLIEPDEKGMTNPFVYQYSTSKTEDIFEFGGLSKSGNISRGVSFGNNQDVVVNSNLNLQLAGKLNDDIEILAAITDNNIPIQPDGNTQQIQEFDKVFIQLSKNQTKLIAGDFVLNRPKSYFMNYYKKAQGGSFSTIIDLNKNSNNSLAVNNLKLTTSAALSKGKYARNIIAGVEGNQGPYKLRGNNNETYIIVLAGSEKIYIDGQLLTRGQSYDYVIDYNTSEVIFTPNNLITKDKRIVIEFEYSDQNYARSLFHAGAEYESSKLNFRFNMFTEQDLKNQSLQQDLDDDQKNLLSNIGDSLQDAVMFNIDSVAFSVNEVLYKMVDSLGYDSVFVYSTNPDSAFYRLGFSLVGQGNGDYIQIKSSGNGRVFQWIEPIGGAHLGSYAPVILLVTPKKKQMFAFGFDYKLSKNTIASLELAVSENDLNTFSAYDNGDNTGYASKFLFENKSGLSKKDTNLRLITKLNYEWTYKYFDPIERYRSVEFERDWNLSGITEKKNENIAGLNITLDKTKTGFLNYQLNYFKKGLIYNALQNQLNSSFNKKGFHVTLSGSLVQTDAQSYTTNYLKHKAGLSKDFKFFTIGVREEQENNAFKNSQTDSLMGNSFAFNVYEIFLMNADTTKNKFKLNYKKRFDLLPFNNDFKKATTGEDFGFTYMLLNNNSNRLNFNASYRRLAINDSLLTNIDEDNTIVSRLEYFSKYFKGAITSNVYYEIGSGLEIKKEFAYLQVEPGQGVYYWNVNETDYNGNGVLDLDEVEIAAFQDQANYIRIFTPTNDFEKVYTNQFSESINLNPAAIWRKEKGFKKFLSKFSNQTVYRVDHKTTEKDFEKAYNPFSTSIDNQNLVTLNSSFRNNLYFNRSHPKFGCDITYQDNSNKILLTNGFDTRTTTKQGGGLRWNITRKIMFNALYNYGKKTSSSEYFKSRDFDIDYQQAEPSFSFQPNNSFRVRLIYTYSKKENVISTSVNNELVENHKLGTEIKYNVAKKGNLLFKFNYIKIAYNSPENTSLAFEMLEGLKAGKNATWNISYQRNLSNNLQLSIIYDGRKSPEVKAVHIGNVQLRAYF